MSWGPDKQGINGVYLGKELIRCAALAVEDVIEQVGLLCHQQCVFSGHQLPWLG